MPKNEMLKIANERGNFPDDPNKKDPLDFVLWQAKKEGEPSWKSPFGFGRPGWHAECSVMSMRYLGNTIDIHGGGHDLIFPHHEAEIAQSENHTGKRFVKFWVHVAMLRYRGDKMSKSKGNLVLVSDLLDRHSPNAIRIMLLSNHYRKEWEYEENMLKDAARTDDMFLQAVKAESNGGEKLDLKIYREKFFGSMNNDIDTPQAIASVRSLSQIIIKIKDADIEEAKLFLREAFSILGLKY